MPHLVDFIAHSVPIYFLLSAFTELCETIGVLLLGAAVLKIRPKRTVPVYAVLTGLILLYGVLRALHETGRIEFGFYLEIGYLTPIAATLLVFPPSKKTWKLCLIGISYDIMTDILVYLVMMFTGYEYQKPEPAGTLLVGVLVGLAVFSVVFRIFLLYAKKNNKPWSITEIGVGQYILILVTVVVFIVSMLLLGENNSAEKRREFYITLLNIPLFAASIGYTVHRFLKSRLAEENYRKQLELQVRHFEEMDGKNEELRIFRHDFPKKIRPILLYMQQEKYAEAMDILREFDMAVESSRPRFKTGNYRLDTVLESEAQSADKRGIRLEFVQGSVFPAEGIAAKDIYTIFPNALDNAMEACEKIGGECTVRFESHIRMNAVYIKISNPFTGKIAGDAFPSTTKADKDRHGYGMKSIKKAAAGYGSDNVSFTAENGIFSLFIVLELRPIEKSQN